MAQEELLKDLRRRMDGAIEVLRKEFGGLRTGRVLRTRPAVRTGRGVRAGCGLGRFGRLWTACCGGCGCRVGCR